MLDAGATVDLHASDQLLIYLALAGEPLALPGARVELARAHQRVADRAVPAGAHHRHRRGRRRRRRGRAATGRRRRAKLIYALLRSGTTGNHASRSDMTSPPP
ncbi:MAG: hypothetical protein MZU91_08590 [Desulfosudis oleivorans]|nr:hypothetical protein [Desulfosudis oleivorans]